MAVMKLYAAELNFRPVAEEFGVNTDFPPEVDAEAAASTDRYSDDRRDARDIDFVTIDPPGSRDLDQAVYIERAGDGFRVLYAIADVAAFVEPGGAVEAESLRRGQTIYLPDEPARLHPAALSEGTASLLPNVDRPAVLWTFLLDASGEVTDVHVERALIRSRAKLDYPTAQADLAAGRIHPSIALLPQVGQLRQASSLRRDAINLRIPSQRVRTLPDGRYELMIDPRDPIMDYNSEISLLTGMTAGHMMHSAGVGILRTLRPARAEDEAEFVREARSLGYHVDKPIPEFLASVDADSPEGMAVMREAQKLLRGSGYGRVENGDSEVHAGVGGYYAHVTAPLRRLVDRFATEYCLALCADREVDSWVSERADEVMSTMNTTSQLASTVDRACLNLTEATVLAPWVGQNFRSVVLQAYEERNEARIFVDDPPMFGRTLGQPAEGSAATVSLIQADVPTRTVRFAWPAD